MKIHLFGLTIVSVLLLISSAQADPMQELIQTLGSEYEALMPAPSGSVGTDYPIRQAAVGSLYTARSIGLIYYQNQEMLARQAAILSRYDRMIEQNRQIIKLLTVISEQPALAEAPPVEGQGSPAGGYTE